MINDKLIKKHPFLAFGLPFLSTVVFGMFLLADIRKSRYSNHQLITKNKQKKFKSLEEDLLVKILKIQKYKSLLL